jgi:hypothetical protein
MTIIKTILLLLYHILLTSIDIDTLLGLVYGELTALQVEDVTVRWLSNINTP